MKYRQRKNVQKLRDRCDKLQQELVMVQSGEKQSEISIATKDSEINVDKVSSERLGATSFLRRNLKYIKLCPNILRRL